MIVSEAKFVKFPPKRHDPLPAFIARKYVQLYMGLSRSMFNGEHSADVVCVTEWRSLAWSLLVPDCLYFTRTSQNSA